jgi:hypothetical protein
VFQLNAACVFGALVLLLSDCRKPITEHECNELLDRYVELLVRSDRPEVNAGELVKLQAEARSKAASDPAFANCTKEVSRSQLECAMRAQNADLLEQCLL